MTKPIASFQSKSGQKRPRPEWHPSNINSNSNSNSVATVTQLVKKEDEEESPPLLTPHTLRLLKLIQEGSMEHAKLATTQLKGITAGSSPLILWEILGRLQVFLLSNDWKTRRNASMAMEGVAHHLPVGDQVQFLQKESQKIEKEREATQHPKQQHLWLTLRDLKGNLPAILQKGRNLLASAETKFEELEDEELEQFDAKLKGTQEFCEERIQLQRQILARRLGLSGILSRCSSGKGIDGAVTGEDLVPSLMTTSFLARATRKRIVNNKEDASKKSVRALLVMEIQQQGELSVISHRNAQTLLAGELIYRMFDASWHVRHGSLMGILALLRAWKVHQSNDSFGTWPHDILARCLCVLALDRFGDFSGAFLETGGVVAPVREMAGQVFSVLFFMSPPSLQKESCEVLTMLAYDNEWEVRHGALVALKYVVALIGNASEASMIWRSDFLAKSIQLATYSIEDQIDDVQSMAAQIVSTIFLSSTTKKAELVGEAIASSISGPLWKSLEKASLDSPTVQNLVVLFATLVGCNCNLVLNAISGGQRGWGGFHRILERLRELLSCEYTSVKRSIIRAIGPVARHLAVYCSSANLVVSDLVFESFCGVVESSFETYVSHGLTFDENEPVEEHEIFIKTCRDSWQLLAQASSDLLAGSFEHRSKLETRLILRYFGLENLAGEDASNVLSARMKNPTKASYGRSFQVWLELANAVAKFLFEGSNSGGQKNHAILELCLRASLDSPLMFQCEAACLLFGALLNEFNGSARNKHPFQKELESCKQIVRQNMTTTPLCIVVDDSKLLDKDPSLCGILVSSFACGVELVKRKGEDGNAASLAVVELWKETIKSKMTAANQVESRQSKITTDSMRLSVSFAAVLIQGGSTFLPDKLTPVVRSLMTSIQNELDDTCQIAACRSMAKMLQLLSSKAPITRIGGFKKTHSKVLSNLCKLIKAQVEPGCTAASRVIGTLVGNISSGTALSDVQPIWGILAPLSVLELADTAQLNEALEMLQAVSRGLKRDTAATTQVIRSFLSSLVMLCCTARDFALRESSIARTKSLCAVGSSLALSTALPDIARFLKDKENDSHRVQACQLLQEILEVTSISICPYVRYLLPLAMSSMTDPMEACAKKASNIFSLLVQVAPLVQESANLLDTEGKGNDKADRVMNHLIHGKPLPPCDIHPAIQKCLEASGVTLRKYQLEGVSWLRFLQTVNLNGALCDSMGLGKTLQALLGVALSHFDPEGEGEARSLVVCPSSVVGHWMREIEQFFPGQKVFSALSFTGSASQRDSIWKERLNSSSLVVTSYSILRSDIDRLSKVRWRYCILDEGHLLKNPKTATAKASRRLKCRHKIILTGTPVQNKVHEVWATFDFLMPNFLGTSVSFSKEFAKPITKGQLAGASASNIALGLEKLKMLHQQVLPFVLRREKEHVLKELPPKSIIVLPCEMAPAQMRLYSEFCSGSIVKKSLHALQRALDKAKDSESEVVTPSLGSEVLKSLLYLRLLCTHPSLINTKQDVVEHDGDKFWSIESSGKLLALSQLLVNAGIHTHDLTAADNDSSLLYCEDEHDQDMDGDEIYEVLEAGRDDTVTTMGDKPVAPSKSKCLIFAQFTHSLDVVEEIMLKRHMPSVRYLRLDGRVPPDKRSKIVDIFNGDESIKIMLLTTRIGGLGLNLTGADTVIFLEHDWNPHADLQAMDRAHRIGQTRTVNVFKLVTTDSIEEKIMKLHETKLAMSDAIVNTDNSTLFSMGTDRLLDIFRFRSEVNNGDPAAQSTDNALDTLVERYGEEYTSLSVGDFISAFQVDQESNDL